MDECWRVVDKISRDFLDRLKIARRQQTAKEIAPLRGPIIRFGIYAELYGVLKFSQTRITDLWRTAGEIDKGRIGGGVALTCTLLSMRGLDEDDGESPLRRRC